MGNIERKIDTAPKRRIGWVVLAVGAAAVLLLPASSAQANIVDRVKEVYRLPEQMDQMQQEYATARQQLTDTLEQSRETEERLMAQNKQLQEQNDALKSRLEAMEQTALRQEARQRKLITAGATAAVLAAVYFAAGRLLRVAVWRRSSGKS